MPRGTEVLLEERLGFTGLQAFRGASREATRARVRTRHARLTATYFFLRSAIDAFNNATV